MRLLDRTIRRTLPCLGTGVRWLKEELHAAGVKVHLSTRCLEELVDSADERACQLATDGATYLECLRSELKARAQFIHTWTRTDEKIDTSDALLAKLVRIARDYALPRPWKLSEPVVSEYDLPDGVRWQWTPRMAALTSVHRV